MPKSTSVYISFFTIANILVGSMFYALSQPLPATVAAETYVATVYTKAKPAIKIRSAMPKRLVVSSLNIDMNVKKASFDPRTQQWTDNGLTASYADASVPVNDHNGTTLIFAHAQWGAFAALPSIQPGAVAKVYGDRNEVYVYEARKTTQVTPNNTSVFRDQGPPTLVLQTCSGAWDAYRTLVYFDFVKVEA